MTVSIDQYRTLLKQIDTLEKRVDGIVDPPLPFTRLSPSPQSLAVTFLEPDMGLQEVTFRSTVGDFWMTRLGYSCWAIIPSTLTGSGPGTTQRMVDMGKGMSYYDGDHGRRQPNFEFSWNMRRTTTQSYYALPSGGTGLLGKGALGNMERNEWLTFSRPWKIQQGDGVTFSIKPLGYDWLNAGVLGLTRYTVNMIMDGFVTGVR